MLNFSEVTSETFILGWWKQILERGFVGWGVSSSLNSFLEAGVSQRAADITVRPPPFLSDALSLLSQLWLVRWGAPDTCVYNSSILSPCIISTVDQFSFYLSFPKSSIWEQCLPLSYKKTTQTVFWIVWVSGFPGGTSGKELACQCRRHKKHGFDPWVRKNPWRRKWQSTSLFCLENPMDRGAWQAMVQRVPKSQPWLNQLGMHWVSGKREIRLLANITFQNKTRVRVSEGGATQLWSQTSGFQGMWWLKEENLVFDEISD